MASDGATTVIYDATGNRTTVTTGAGSVNYTTSTGNQLSSDGVHNYTYNAEGNMTKKIVNSSGIAWKYGSDHANHLTSVQKWSEDPDTYGTAVLQMDAAYQYDVLGNRIEKSVDMDGSGAGSAVVSRFAYDGWNPAKSTPVGLENFDIWGDFTGAGSLTTRYLRGDNVDELAARVDGSTPYWFLSDHLGSIRNVIDSGGAIKDTIVYDAFGNITSESDANYGGRYKWTTREVDVESELQYNRERYYDPQTSRWITEDPLGFDAGDSNLYRYVMNRPTIATDPTGMFIVASRDEAKSIEALFGKGNFTLPDRGNYTMSKVVLNAGAKTFYDSETQAQRAALQARVTA